MLSCRISRPTQPEHPLASLQTALGKGYDIVYPEIQSDESAPDFGWTRQIGKKISAANDDMILAGHSFGASMILK